MELLYAIFIDPWVQMVSLPDFFIQVLWEGFVSGVLYSLIALGFVLAGWRAHAVAGPVLDWRYYGPVEGRIVGMDRSASDAVRLTLDHVKLDRVAPGDTPTRVRISLHGDAALGVAPEPGLRVMTTAHLGPPGGPVEPGGFDFQRHAWFAELGAVGYTRVPLMAISLASSCAIFDLSAAFSLRVLFSSLAIDSSSRTQRALTGLSPSGASRSMSLSGSASRETR